jgi:hypothetical protein
MHSVPNYGDKPADRAVGSDRSPIVALLDLKASEIRRSPWRAARAVASPFITLSAIDSFSRRRNISAFVAMSTSTKGLRATSAVLRQRIAEQLANVTASLVTVIKRRSYSTFKAAVTALPETMARARLCIVPPGDAPSSKRFYDAISHFCVPYLLADYFWLPYEDILVDYEKCVRQLPARRVETLARDVAGISNQEIKKMRKALKAARERFTWNYEEKPKAGQALWALTWALYDRIRMMKPYMNDEMTGDAADPEFSIIVQ